MNDPAYMQLYSITGGNDLLIDAIARRLSADVRLNANVTAIKKGVGNTLELSWKATDGSKSEGFDAVVIALPIEPLKKLDFPDSDLASAMQSHIAHHDHPAITFESPFSLKSPSGNRGFMIRTACSTRLMVAVSTTNRHEYRRQSWRSWMATRRCGCTKDG